MTEHAIDQTAVKRLERSRSDRMLAGVCEGLARYFDINPAFYRVGFVVLTLLGGAGILIYLAAVLVIPAEGTADSIGAETLRSRKERPWPLVGLGLIAVAAAVLLSRATLWPEGDAAWVLVLLAGGLILWTQRAGRSTSTEVVLGSDGRSVETSRRGGSVIAVLSILLATIVVATLAAAAVAASVFHVNLHDGVGQRTYQPADASDLKPKYRLGVGDLRIDLLGMQLPVGMTRVDARVGVGSLEVIVPEGVTLRVDATAQAGEVDVLGRSDDGRHADLAVTEPGGLRVLVLDARVGAGNVRVTRSLP